MKYSARLALLLFIALSVASFAQDAKKNGEEKPKPDFPDYDKVVTKEFSQVSHPDGSFIALYKNSKNDQLLAGIPKKLIGQEFLLATSIAEGPLRGYQTGDWLLRFEQHDKDLLIIAPNTQQTASGPLQSVVKETYPDSLIAKARIKTKSPSGEIIIDMKGLLAANSRLFTGYGGGGFYGYYGFYGGASVTEVAKAVVYPENTDVAIRFRGGSTTASYFSFAKLRASSGFKPRVADQRVGYFLTAKEDFGKDPRADTTFDRYINRWHIEKAQSGIDLSPAKDSIIFYIEDSVPIKYRRWVREGIEKWNPAFEKIGIVNAIEVRQQTKSNEFAKRAPEDARYNFFRWIASGRAFAMGPSRVNPRTGEILDADIIFDESMVRSYLRRHDLLVASLNVDDLTLEERDWLAKNPHRHPLWSQIQDYVLAEKAENRLPEAMTPETWFSAKLEGRDTPTPHRHSRGCSMGAQFQSHFAFCSLAIEAAPFIQYNLAQAAEKGQLTPEELEEAIEESSDLLDEIDTISEEADDEESEDDSEKESEDSEEPEEEDKEEEKKEKGPDPFKEWPEEMVGQIIREIVAHEVGHTLGLRHNFKASAWLEYDELMAIEDDSQPTVASVMDYNPLQLRPDGSTPELWTTPVIGPYDMWAIEYGYAIPGQNGYDSNEKKMLAQIAARSSEPGHEYQTDEDVSGPDPRTARFDLGRESLDYAEDQMELAANVQDVILDAFVRPGDSYERARYAYRITLNQMASGASMAAGYIGGHYISRDQNVPEDILAANGKNGEDEEEKDEEKESDSEEANGGNGDKDVDEETEEEHRSQPPITVVDAAKQRRAMKLLTEKILGKDAFKIDPELQRHLAAGRWYHWGSNDPYQPLTYPVQDDILSIQKMVLFQLFRFSTIQNLYDSEFRVEAETDLFTLPEMMQTLTDSIWTELGEDAGGSYTTRRPMISNTRRNLQRAHLSELIQTSLNDENSRGARVIARTLATQQLVNLHGIIDPMLEASRGSLDPYTLAHLNESKRRIEQTLEAEFTINGGGMGGFPFFMIMQPGPDGQPVPAGSQMWQGTAAPGTMPQPNASQGVQPQADPYYRSF